jgi:uncharacterized protein YndB with AHSA1/START domain
MTTVSASTTINQPAATVFSYLVDVKNHTTWNTSLKEASVTPDGPVAVGSTYNYVTEVMGQKYPSAMQVSAYQENKVWAVKVVGPNPVETVYQFDEAGGATTLTITMELAGGYPAAAEGAIKAQMQKSLVDQGNAIKAAVGG